MESASAPLDIAYLHYGEQSGVTPHVVRALAERGHTVHALSTLGPLEWRDEARRLRPSARSLAHLMFSAARFGRDAFAHRWNTTYAFDVHSAQAGRLVSHLPRRPDIVLQHGGLFAPGAPPSQDYVLLLDHTRALTMSQQLPPDVGLSRPKDYGPGWKERETRLYRDARAIATFSRRVALSLEQDYGVSGERIHVVGGGANVWPEVPAHQDDGDTILFVGKDFQRKGGPVLLRAFEQLRKHRKRRTRLLIAGPRERLALPPGAIQVGRIPMERLADLFSRATVFALPTLREPYGLAFLDAMACAVPSVGTLVGAVPELIEHGITGLLVAPGDDIALARALASILDDPPTAKTMGEAGRKRAEERFRWRHVGARLEAALSAPTSALTPPDVIASFTVA